MERIVFNPSKTAGIKQVFVNRIDKQRKFYFITQNSNGSNRIETPFEGSTLLEYGYDSSPHVYWLNDTYFITSPTDSLYGCCMVNPPGYRVYCNMVAIMDLPRDDFDKTGHLNIDECKIEDGKLIICRTFYSELDKSGRDYVTSPVNKYETYNLKDGTLIP